MIEAVKSGIFCGLTTLALITFAPQQVAAELYINEIFSDPGGAGSDAREAYVELRGATSMSLANHYLLIIENENNQLNTGTAGVIETIFNLGPYSLGSNGFLTLRQKGSLYTQPAPGTTDLVNTGSGPGFGSTGTSSIGASDLAGTGEFEGSGFTAMLIRNDGDAVAAMPTLGLDLDNGNDGLDPVDPLNPNHWRSNWSILDSIGIYGEAGEARYGRLYGQVNFGPEKVGEPFTPLPGSPIFTTPNIEPGTTYTGLGYEVEAIARWGNSTGQTPADWHITNLTDNGGSGSAGVFATGGPDWRQSCIGNNCHPLNDGNPATPAPQPANGTESNKSVPYGTKLTDTLGAPNFMFGDYNKNGFVDAADCTVWQDTFGRTGTESAHPAADPNHDFLVNQTDYNIWVTNFQNSGPGSALGSQVPEPSTMSLLAFGCLALCTKLRRIDS